MFRFLRHHALAALFAALALGVGARLVMRLISRASNLPGSYSTGGSVEVVIFGGLIGFPAALAFFALRQRVKTRLAWPGLAFGGMMFLGLALLPPSSARSAMANTPDPPVTTAVLFLTLFLLFGALLELHWWRWLERNRIP